METALDVGSAFGSVSSNFWYHVYLIANTTNGVVDVLISQSPTLPPTSVTATSASPCVFTWSSPVGGTNRLPFQNGAQIMLGGTAVPTGFTAGVIYFVVGATPANGTFSLSSTQGGTAINSSSSGSSVTAASGPTLPTGYSKKRRIGTIRTDVTPSIMSFTQNGDLFLWTSPFADFSGAALSTAAALYFLANAPLGVNVTAVGGVNYQNPSGGLNGATLLMSSPFQPMANATAPGGGQVWAGLTMGTNGIWQVLTDKYARIVATSSQSLQTFSVATFGWYDTRGK